jgi:hypothetical protein
MFPDSDGVSDSLSPLAIITGAAPPDYNTMKLEFGTYVQIFNENTPSNTMATRTTGAIALNSVHNSKGDYYFLNLDTGKRVSRHQWTVLPMPKSVIQQVSYLALREKQPLLKNQCLLFERRPGIPIDDEVLAEEAIDELIYGDEGEDDDFSIGKSNDLPLAVDTNVSIQELIDIQHDSSVALQEAEEEDGTDDVSVQSDNTIAAATTEAPTVHFTADAPTIFEEGASNNRLEEGAPETNQDGGAIQESTDVEDDLFENIEPDVVEEITAVTEDDVSDDRVSEMPTPPEPPTHGYNLRNRDELNQGPSFNDQFDDPASNQSYAPAHLQFFQQSVSGMVEDPQRMHDHLCDLYEHIVEFSFNQMSAKDGIAKHGEAAVMALFKEFAQLHDKRVFKAIRASDLSFEQKKNALHAINIIKEKRNGVLKGRTVADGRKQRPWYNKHETTSPTISNDSLMTILTVSAAEKRKIAMWDVEGAYLLADQDDFVLVKFTGNSVDILCQVDEEYKQFVTIENGKKVIYLQLLKALYGCLRSALLWYELYSGKLQGMGFELNPYDMCVANKDINGKQCTIGYYVDDNVATHVEDDVLSGVINSIESEVGAITVSRGKTHNFLGMEITFNDDGTLSIRMEEYIAETLREFPDKLRKSASTPARADLQQIDSSSKLLNKERSEAFHSLVMKLMFLCQRCRLDITTAISFLCTRVQRPTEEDWAKLKRCLEFLNGTIGDPMVLGAESLDKLLNFVDVSFAVHPDMKSHTGGGASFGRGVFMSQSKKQKINTTSTTESEVVGVSDYLPNTVWLLKFLEAQGYKVKKCVLYQDNESAIKLLKFGKSSSSRRTRHFDIRFFGIKDKLILNNIDIEYCPTEYMVADFFTKPLQGYLFKRLRRIIMGMDPISSLNIDGISLSKERVGSLAEDPILEKDSGAGVMSYADALRASPRQDVGA